MQRRIVVMAEDLSSKIAAGEVIERPASILKELVENSLDAGADDILVDLEKGGKTSIRVTDNGEGMSRDDAAMAFERYATSKILRFEDIYSIHSFGFRGEALPSIAIISKCEMLTKRRRELSGTRVVIEGGKTKEIIEAGCPAGTSMLVTDIFYTTPVRRKFLKKDSTEQSHCIDAVVRLALAHPAVRIRVISSGREILNLPKTDDLSERVASVLGEDFIKQMVPVEGGLNDVTLRGFISRPTVTRSNTRGIYYFINGRFVRDSFFNNAVLTPYRRLIEPKRFPAIVLYVTIPPVDVDVNVHPTKMEVRFRNPWEIHQTISHAIASSLAEMASLSDGATVSASGGTGDAALQYRQRIQDSLKRYTLFSGEKKIFFREVHGRESPRDMVTPSGVDGMRPLLEKITFSSLDYIEQIAGTYLLFSSPDGIVLVDQHAAHERVLFDKMMTLSSERRDEQQVLLIPEVVNLSPGKFDLVMSHGETLRDIGFGIEPYGEQTVAIKSIPSVASNIDLEETLSDIIEEIEKTGKFTSIEKIKEKILALVACKSAVKANHKLTEPEVERLCGDLDLLAIASTCPHGRPLYVKFGIEDMEKMFKRR